MSNAEPDATPLIPAYGFNGPGEPLLLFEGKIGGLAAADVDGLVELSCVPRPCISWRVENDGRSSFLAVKDVNLRLRRPGGDVDLPAVERSHLEGWSNGATFGDPSAPLRKIVAHWFNLPALHGHVPLIDDGSTRQWRGRWVAETCGWRITLDARPDHSEVFTELHRAHVHVMTHVMEIQRVDGGLFTADSAAPVLEALHVGFSFLFGSWVAPMLPVGYDAAGGVAWEDWRIPHCDPARQAGNGWLPLFENPSIVEFIDLTVTAFADSTRRDALRFQMMLGVEATNDRGFVEQRIMAGVAGIEHALWQILVRGGHMTEAEYEGSPGRPKVHAHAKLRKALGMARVSTNIDAARLPATVKYSANKGRLDGPDVVTQVRNRLVHPRDAQERVYDYPGLMTDVWYLARDYLVQLVLYQLQYSGKYRHLIGFDAGVAYVPWR